ncbi:MAG: GNAT family N-acetyltransferase [Bacteroidaceae bacterium]|nr:GNAT family N-acetyltransferase [Bacteroidaceae bacterium]
MDNLSIICATTFESSHYEAVNQLLSQLTSRSIVFAEDDYRQLIEAPHSHLFLLFHGGSIVGMLTVGIYLSPTGSKAWIEDVVVDEASRGLGLGRMLVAHAIDFCRQQQVDTLMLTSNPKRIAANALYRSLGFEQKETNVYRMVL